MLVVALASMAFSPIVACGQTDMGKSVPSAPKADASSSGANATAVIPLKGSMPPDPSTTAVHLQKLDFPAGSTRVRVYIQAPGLQTGSTEASGYVDSVSPNHAHAPQDFELRLNPDQVRVLASHNATAADTATVAIVIEAVDRAGKPVPGAKAERATLVDGGVDDAMRRPTPGRTTPRNRHAPTPCICTGTSRWCTTSRMGT